MRLTGMPAMLIVHVLSPVPVVTAPGGLGGSVGEGGGGGGYGGGDSTGGTTNVAVNETTPTTNRMPRSAAPTEIVPPTATPAMRVGDHFTASSKPTVNSLSSNLTARTTSVSLVAPSAPMCTARGRRASQLDECTPSRNSWYAPDGGILHCLSYRQASSTGLMR